MRLRPLLSTILAGGCALAATLGQNGSTTSLPRSFGEWTPPPSREKTLRVDTPDGVKLEGVLVMPESEPASSGGYPLAVLFHSFGRHRDALLPLADELAARGVASAVMDLRGHGSSLKTEGGKVTLFAGNPARNLQGAVPDGMHVLRSAAREPRIDGTRIFLVGVGEGALVATTLAARVPAISGLVVVDPSDPLAGFDPEHEIDLLGDRPALFVGSEIPASRRRVEAWASHGGGERTVRTVADFADEERLLGYGQGATMEVVSWIVEQL